MNKIKSILSVFIFGGLIIGCNSEPDDLGQNLFDGSSAAGEQVSYDLTAYNINNGDVVRADSYALQRAVLGAFAESQFGMQKSAYVTQVRLSSYNPNFGTNPVVDSVVLEIKPQYNAASRVVTTANITYNGQSANQTLTKYDVVKYGNSANTINIDVHEITTDLGSVGTEILSNKTVVEGNLLGTKSFTGNIFAVNLVQASNNESLLTRDAGIRIPLNANYFQTKIADRNGASELSDESNFVNYFKGFKISVQENDGYLMNFAPNEVTMTMYYKSGESTNRTSSSFSFNLGSSNVHFSQISYSRSPIFNNVMSNIDSTNGDALLYMQGMGGSGAGIKLEGTGISDLKRLYRERSIAIVSARVRLYTDVNNWNNSYTKPTGFLVKKQGETDFITDLQTMLRNANYSLVRAYSTDANPSYYDIDITKTIKDIVEKEEEAKDLIISVGDYLTSNGNLVSESYNNNVSSPYRAVLVGTDVTNNNRPKLMVTYVAR